MDHERINADSAYLDFYITLIDACLDALAQTVRELEKRCYVENYTCCILDSKDLDIQ